MFLWTTNPEDAPDTAAEVLVGFERGTPVSLDGETPRYAGTRLPMKMVAIRIWVGQRPLQSEKLLVMMAINLSRGLSMIRVEITPAALHPNPMVMLRACLPCAPAFRKI